MDAPRKRPYGYGSVSVQRNRYVVTFKDLKTGKPARRSFLTDADAQAYLDDWCAAKQARKAGRSVGRVSGKPRRTTRRRGVAPSSRDSACAPAQEECMDTPQPRPYGHRSVSIQLGAYVATFNNLKTGKTVRRGECCT